MVSSFYPSGYDSKRKRSTKTPSRKYEAENTSWRDESVHRGGQDSYQKTSRCGKNLKSSNTESYVRNKYLSKCLIKKNCSCSGVDRCYRHLGPTTERESYSGLAGQSIPAACLNVRSIKNKTAIVANIINENKLSILGLTETWHESYEDVALKKITLPGYRCIESARRSDETGRTYGGIAVIYKDTLSAKPHPLGSKPATFEITSIMFSSLKTNFIFVVIYRPGGNPVSDLFFTELESILETLATYNLQIIITGDLNVRVNISNDPHSIRFLSLIRSFGFIQSVVGPTHTHGNTLDLVITRSDLPPPSIIVDLPQVSDHSLVRFRIPVRHPPPLLIDVNTRAWRSFDPEQFRSDLQGSSLCNPAVYETMSISQVLETFDTTLSSLLHKHAPPRVARLRDRPLTPWFDSECAALKRRSRKLERRYRRTQDPIDRTSWINHVRTSHDLYRQKQNLYWKMKIDDSRGSPGRLWRTLSGVLGRVRSNPISPKDLTANDFSRAFNDKIRDIRQSTSHASSPRFDPGCCSCDLLRFKPVSVDDITRLIKSSPNKNCSLDPIPTWMIKQYSSELAPFVTFLVNSSLERGQFPPAQKNAVITPILKKPNLDPLNTGNYRPISNLSYLSKLLERCVAAQINIYLRENNLLPMFQSAYRNQHSTETAVLKVLSDIYAAADSGRITLLGLLDLSAAFDTVDHQILVNRLHFSYGFGDVVLEWFRSYLTDRSHCIRSGGVLSTPTSVLCGVPQGSVLGPLLFLLYSADVLHIATKHRFSVHSYADDLQIYDHSPPASCSDLVPRMSACISEIGTWMASNRLQLNPSKTEVIWLGSPGRLSFCPKGDLVIAGVSVRPSTYVRNLGVMVDSSLSMEAHISHLTRSCFYHLRQLRVVRRSLTMDSAHSLIRALVHSRLDYCNGVMAGLRQFQINRLQSILRAAARLVLQLPGWSPVSDLMRTQLHWLPFPQRIQFKLGLMVYKCLHHTAPVYLQQLCVPISTLAGRSHLRSAAAGDLFVPSSKTTTLGRRGFSTAGPVVWNSLSADLRNPALDLGGFRKLLKTELYS